MNQELISQLCFVTRFVVDARHTASSVFAQLPSGTRYAHHLADVLCSGHLLAQLESLCIDAMRELIDWDREVVLGVAMQLDHGSTAAPGETVEVHGFVAGLGDRSVRFVVEASIGPRRVAAGTMDFAVIGRERTAPHAGTVAATGGSATMGAKHSAAQRPAWRTPASTPSC